MKLNARIGRLEATPAIGGRVCPDCGRIDGTRLLAGGRRPEYKVVFETEMGVTSENELLPQLRHPACGGPVVR